MGRNKKKWEEWTTCALRKRDRTNQGKKGKRGWKKAVEIFAVAVLMGHSIQDEKHPTDLSSRIIIKKNNISLSPTPYTREISTFVARGGRHIHFPSGWFTTSYPSLHHIMPIFNICITHLHWLLPHLLVKQYATVITSRSLHSTSLHWALDMRPTLGLTSSMGGCSIQVMMLLYNTLVLSHDRS